MENTIHVGATGLILPVINTSVPPKEKKTTAEVAKWCAALPLADTGVAAKKLFVAQEEILNTPLTAKERFDIMELLRSPNKIIGTALKRHYIEQRAPLTDHKLTIANLRQTLSTHMSDNYKLILEELHKSPLTTDVNKEFMATTICRILYYLNILLICRYQLYAFPPSNIWREIHLLYKYARDRNLLELHVPCQFSPNENKTSVLESYTRIIMLYATDPYQWRQREQHSLNKAIELWALYPTIYKFEQIPDKKAGIYIIDLDKDAPPTLYSFKNTTITPTCIALDLANCVNHLQEISDKMKAGQMQAKMEHSGDPEFIVTTPTISKLINIWSQNIARSAPRVPTQAQIKIAFGLATAHYYLNDEQEFNAHPTNIFTGIVTETNAPKQQTSATTNLPELEVSEEEETLEDLKEKLSFDEVKGKTEKPITTVAEPEPIVEEEISKEELYHMYFYNIENISPTGFCIVIRDKSYPPFQAGEVVVFKNTETTNAQWSIGAVRWLRRTKEDEFQIGIQIITEQAKPAGIQMLRGDKPATRLLRCIVLPPMQEPNTPPMLLTTALPQQSDYVMLYVGNTEPVKVSLTKEVDASGMYYQYEYSTALGEIDPLSQKRDDKDKDNPSGGAGPDEEKTNTEFDTIWSDL